MSMDFARNTVPPAIGNVATESAMRKDNMVRTKIMQLRAEQYPISHGLGQMTILRAHWSPLGQKPTPIAPATPGVDPGADHQDVPIWRGFPVVLKSLPRGPSGSFWRNL